MYEETVNSGDIEGAMIMKKMIRKLSSRIINEKSLFENKNNEINNSDDIDVDDIKHLDDDFKFIDDIIDNIDNIEITVLTHKLGNISDFSDMNMDYDNFKINKKLSFKAKYKSNPKFNIQTNNDDEKNKIKEYHKEKFREIKRQQKINKEKFRRTKLYFGYKKLYKESISNGEILEAQMLQKIVHTLFK